jgi:hypothetical protein
MSDPVLDSDPIRLLDVEYAGTWTLDVARRALRVIEYEWYEPDEGDPVDFGVEIEDAISDALADVVGLLRALAASESVYLATAHEFASIDDLLARAKATDAVRARVDKRRVGR